ncbi:MAG: hypothetical protein AB7S26_18265 [Sandaracinaceae bacterium]
MGSAKRLAVSLALVGLVAAGCGRRGMTTYTPTYLPPVVGYAPVDVYGTLLTRARSLGYYAEVDDRTLFFSVTSGSSPTSAYVRAGNPRRAYLGGSRFDVQVYSDSSFSVSAAGEHVRGRRIRRDLARERDRLVQDFVTAIRELQSRPAPQAAATPVTPGATLGAPMAGTPP